MYFPVSKEHPDVFDVFFDDLDQEKQFLCFVPHNGLSFEDQTRLRLENG